ncbi:MAG: hypothetical protein ABI476_00995 [Oxalobacteraceae bacterium]
MKKIVQWIRRFNAGALAAPAISTQNAMPPVSVLRREPAERHYA